MKNICRILVLLISSCASQNKTLIKNDKIDSSQFEVEPSEEKNVKIPIHNKPNLKKGEHWVPIINFNDIVDGNNVDSAISQIEQVTKDGAEAIIFTINSPGGSVGEGIRLAYKIENSSIPVHCLVDQGLAASMGSYLLESCTTRSMTKRGVLMFHQISLAMMAEVRENDINNVYEMLKALDKSMAEHNTLKTKISKEYFLNKIDRGAEWWLNWDEAYNDGFVERIITSLSEMQNSLTKNLKLPKTVN